MAESIPTRMRLTNDDRDALKEYWRFYEPIAGEINADMRKSLAELPEWAPLVRQATPQQTAQNEARTHALQRSALVDGDWAPYLQDLNAQGSQYARMGISVVAWYDVIAIYREI